MLYQAPDIRKQTIEQAEAFISAKRARRMIVLMTYKQKLAEKNATIKEYEVEKFTKQVSKFNKLMEKVTEDIEKLATMAKTIGDTHNRIVNVENSEVNL
mgnify:CR=1 FL=1